MSDTPDNSEPTHEWELRGGATVQNSKPSIPTGVSLWQCLRCGLAATRTLTARNEGLNSVVPEPDVEEPCNPPGADADGGQPDADE